jgi:iron complex outermembrane receptor protein
MKTPRLRWILIVPVLLLSLGTRASAQSPAPDDKKKDEVDVLNALVVTGSNIPTAADESDVPITVIGQQDLQNTGMNANLLDILRKKIPAISGRSNAGSTNATNTNQNTAGGSQLAIRNLDTLVLVNGRRLSTSGINGIGGKSFVDINQIPAAAIDHMEVLTDGASAIYGSDAIGGVVNIILKSDYQGGEIGGRYAFTDNNGNYSERSAYVVAGASTDKVHLTVTGSWSKTDPLWQYQRSFINPNLRTGTTFPGFVSGNYLASALATPSAQNPTGTAATAGSMAALIANGTYLAAGSASIPLFNVAPFQSILLQTDQRAAIVNGSVDLIGKKLVAFGDFMHTENKSFNQTSGFLGNLRSVTVPAGSPYDPLTVAATGVVVGTTATPLQTYNDAKGNRLTAGLRGEINPEWNWEAGYVYSESDLNQQLKNEVYLPNLAPAIAGGFDSQGNTVAGGKYSKVLSLITNAVVLQPALDPFARSGVDPLSQANVYGTELIKTKSKLSSFDAKLVGEPFTLPGGKVGVAIGAASRKETLIGTPDDNSYNLSTDPTRHNWFPGTFFDPFSKSRTIDSYFAEVRIPLFGDKFTLPLLHALDLSVAGRAEKYSDAGKSNVPKLGLRWQPFDDQFTVRFTYSKSFTAPTLYSEYGPPSAALTTADLFFNNLGINDTRLKGVTYYSGNGNNPDLNPSTAQSRSLGFAFSPKALKGLTISVDYANVTQDGLAAGIGASAIVASVNQLGSASPYFSAISVGGFPGQAGASQTLLTAPQGLYHYIVGGSYNKDIYILDHFVNSGRVHIEAIDFNIEYELHTASMGKFTFSTAGSYLEHFQVQDLPGAVVYEDAGYSTNGKTMSGTLPHLRLYTTVEWERNGWGALLANNYFGSTTDIGSGAIPSVYLLTNPATKVSAYQSWDAQISYDFGHHAAHDLWSMLKGMKVSVGINNLANRMPPLAPKSNPAGSNNNNVDVSTYSPIGRLFFVSADVKF